MFDSSKISTRIRDYAISHYEKLDTNNFVIGKAPFNRKCHLNSVQEVEKGKAVKVFSCFSIDKTDNSQCVHFINQLADGTYQDNTWGWLYKDSEYYLIKEISKDEQKHIWDNLSNTKKSLVLLNSTAFERFIYRIKPTNFI